MEIQARQIALADTENSLSVDDYHQHTLGRKFVLSLSTDQDFLCKSPLWKKEAEKK